MTLSGKTADTSFASAPSVVAMVPSVGGTSVGITPPTAYWIEPSGCIHHHSEPIIHAEGMICLGILL